ncbi:hypothetical protein DCE79_01810 [Lysinibacillus sp. 2017]|uniref:TetR/AcrR family transcriptional regulator n=1 Tax=unclassified Lysinibacillus TaxID=2636778 RepID=UPI000D52924A|nr:MULTISPECIES: TetR/AcrR family transcriptional regulator [unclassified Lysinibacillus]AWE06194.1 hypothetical protein DCE79_01810 [Lysinibacillus sp. 2017]TGN35154.1 TetR/AcrR family transcriptional regulator [Lysinibacillus sp. S2017]
MSSQRIKASALCLFTERGYEGASLADIIADVGIKKSSIYNHYKSKDDLFLSIYESCIIDELNAMKDFFSKPIQPDELLSQLKAYIKYNAYRAKNILSSQFLFRFIVFPPHHLKELLVEKAEHYFSKLQGQFIDYLQTHDAFSTLSDKQKNDFTHLYCVLLQGIQVDQFLGGGYCTQERLEISWAYFEQLINLS